jgi:ribosomal protein S18 acetylase RimI-like enzyme
MTTPVDPAVLEPVAARAWPAARSRTLGDWSLYATDGHSMRINACWVAGDPGLPLEAALDEVEAWYRAQGQRPIFKCGLGPQSVEPLALALAARGFGCGKETLVMTGPVGEGPADGAVSVSAALDLGFGAVFSAIAQDPGDAAERLGALDRIAAPRFFAQIHLEGEPAAIGACAVEGPWVGIFGMRTAPQARRRGLAGKILSTLLARAREAGAGRAYLQVEASNLGAIPLYERAGFEVGYRYYYWDRLAAH